MKFLFRLDANTKVGMGHSARSFRLAEELLKNGFSCELLTSKIEATFLRDWFDLLKEDKRLSITESVMTPGSTEDLLKIEEFVAEKSVSWVIIDSYAFTDEQISTLRKKLHKLTCKLMIFEDFGNYDKDVDLILNQNPSPTSGQFISEHNGLVLEGLNYFLCPNWVQEIQRKRLSATAPLDSKRQILISMGGADMSNLGLDIAQNLLIAHANSITIKYACTSNTLGYEHACKVTEKFGDNLSVFYHPKLSDIAHDCDTVICAGGVTSLEMLAAGLSVNILLLANNQNRGAQVLKELGIANVYSNKNELIEDIVHSLENDHNIDCELNNAKSIFNFGGAARVVHALSTIETNK